jgi:hypothetical protein
MILTISAPDWLIRDCAEVALRNYGKLKPEHVVGSPLMFSTPHLKTYQFALYQTDAGIVIEGLSK